MIFPGRFAPWPWLAGLLAFPLLVASSATAELPGAVRFHKNIEPILTQYCYDCHADGVNKGGVAFDEFESGQAVLKERDLWWNVLKYVRAGLMPPAKKPRPADEAKRQIAEWIKADVFGIDPRNADPGRVTVRRLNRVEYRNSIRDLLGVDFNTEVEFPADDTGYGFDNIGDVLTLSPLLMEKYIAAAKAIVAQGVPTTSKAVPELTLSGTNFHTGDGGRDRERGAGRDSVRSLPYDQLAALSARFKTEHPGSYRLVLELGVRGPFEFDTHKCSVVFKLDDAGLLQKEFGWAGNKAFSFEFNTNLNAGAHRLSFELQPLEHEGEETNALLMRIVSVTIHGPLEPQYWTKPKGYDRFFPRAIPANSAERRRYARETLGRIAGQAYRRPVNESTLNRLTALAESAYTQPGKTFESGIAYATEAIISSPRFLFRLEENVPGDSPTAPWSPVDEYSLASRLSYFLWSTMPDDELVRLGRGELRKNLAGQVQRMMADPRSHALVENFTGQWLQVRDLQGIAINARVVLARDDGTERQLRQQREAFLARLAAREANARLARTSAPDSASETTNTAARADSLRRLGRLAFGPPRVDLDTATRQAMKSEAEMFFASIVNGDRNVTDLLDSHYTFLNESLARLYGLTNLNVVGPQMRRVALPADSPRGGILTLGSVLAVTSNPDRTSPVKRGVFVLNNILGTPAPPPPPNVPALEASEKDSSNGEPSLRAALEMHRNQPLCASCHARVDPIGLGLENFNALGMWREKERNQPIEPAGKLITGESFSTVQELKHILATEHRTDFYRCLTEKLLTYALGRGLEYYDVGTVDDIVQRLERDQGRFSALLMGIIESAPFQERRRESNVMTSEAAEPSRDGADPQLARNQITHENTSQP